MSFNIILDIDDVVLQWQEAYAERFNTKIPKSFRSSNLIKRRLEILTKEKDFWINIKPKHIPNFTPKAFVSARGIPKAWTVESLSKNNNPGRSNVYQVNWGKSKLELLKSLNVDIFIDDKPETFYECNKNGVFCLLMDAEHNKKIKTKYRIFDLNIENIMQKYESLYDQTKRKTNNKWQV